MIISDTDDIDMLGDKIDAAYPGQKAKEVLDDDEDSDEEKRCWRSEKSKSSGDKAKKAPVRRKVSPRRRKISGPPASKRRSRFVISSNLSITVCLLTREEWVHYKHIL